jgi:hypothetical protein
MRIHLDSCVRTDEDRHLVKRYFNVVIPTSSFQTLTCEEMDPLSFWQIDVPAVLRIHDRTYQKYISEVIFVIDMPYLSVVRVMNQ